ncbi:MAG: hypothetical protein JJE52_01285 [Acidimicrobiia bacterium]|nr:hypothetical protein [Acidimicrobiia bacterium]
MRAVGTVPPPETASDDDEPRAPWHFWVMVVGVVLYLGWRLVELVMWAVRNWL